MQITKKNYFHHHPFNKEEFRDGSAQPHGFNSLYPDYPQFYQWNNKQQKWQHRKNNTTPQIGIMHYVNYNQRKRYFLRILNFLMKLHFKE